MQHSEAKAQLLNLNAQQRPKTTKPPLVGGGGSSMLNQSDVNNFDTATQKRQSKWSINIQEIVKRTQRNLERGSSVGGTEDSGKASSGFIPGSGGGFEQKTSTSSGAPTNQKAGASQKEMNKWSSLSQNKTSHSGTGLKQQKASGSYFVGKEKSSLLSHDLKKKMNVEQKTSSLAQNQNMRSSGATKQQPPNGTHSSLGSNFAVRKVESTGGLGAFRSAKSMRPSSAAAQIAAKSLHMANQRSAGGHSTLLDRASLQIARRGEIQQQPQQSIQEALYGQWKSASNAKVQQSNNNSRVVQESGTGAPGGSNPNIQMLNSNHHQTLQETSQTSNSVHNENSTKLTSDLYKIDDFSYQVYGCRTLEQRASSKALQVAIAATSEHNEGGVEEQEEDLEAMIVQGNARRLKKQTQSNLGSKVRQNDQNRSKNHNAYLRTDGAMQEIDDTNQEDLLGGNPSLGRRLSQRESSSIERLQQHLRQQLDGPQQDYNELDTDDRPALSTNNFFTDQALNLSKQIKTLRPSSSTEHVLNHHYKNKTQNSSSQNNQVQYQKLQQKGKTAEQVENRLRIFEEEIIKRVKEIQRYVKSLHLQLKKSAGAQDKIKQEIDGDKDILLDLQSSVENQAKRFAADKLKLVTNSELDGRFKDFDQDLSQKLVSVVQEAIEETLTQVRDELIPNSRFKMYDSISEESNRLKIELEHQMAQLRKDQADVSKHLRDSVQETFKKEAVSLRRELKSEVSAENLRINAQVETQIAKALQDAQNNDTAKSELQSLKYELLDEIRVSEERQNLKAADTNRYLRTQIEDQLPQKIQKLQVEISKQKESDMKRFVSVDSLGVKLNSLRNDLEEISNKQAKSKIDGLKNVFATQDQVEQQLMKAKKSMTHAIRESLQEQAQEDLLKFQNQIETYQLEQEQLIGDLQSKIDKSIINDSANQKSRTDELLEKAEKMVKLQCEQNLKHFDNSLVRDLEKDVSQMKENLLSKMAIIETSQNQSKITAFNARTELEKSVDQLRKQIQEIENIQKDCEFEMKKLQLQEKKHVEGNNSSSMSLISEEIQSFKDQTKFKLEDLEQRIKNKVEDRVGESEKTEIQLNDLTDDLSQLKLNFSAYQKKITNELAQIISHSNDSQNLGSLNKLSDQNFNSSQTQQDSTSQDYSKKLSSLEEMIKSLDEKVQSFGSNVEVKNTNADSKSQQNIEQALQKVELFSAQLNEAQQNQQIEIERLQKVQQNGNTRLDKLESVCDLKADLSLVYEREQFVADRLTDLQNFHESKLKKVEEQMRSINQELEKFKGKSGPSTNVKNEITEVERKVKAYCEKECQNLALKMTSLAKTKEMLVADLEDLKIKLDNLENSRSIQNHKPLQTKAVKEDSDFEAEVPSQDQEEIVKEDRAQKQSIQQLTTDISLKQGNNADPQMTTKASGSKMDLDKSPHESIYDSKSSPQAKSFKIPVFQQSLSARPESNLIVDPNSTTEQEQVKMHTDRNEIQNGKEESERHDDSADEMIDEKTVNDEEPSNMVFDSCTEDKSKFMDPSTLDRREAPLPINEIKDPVQFEMANESDIKVQETESSQANLCIQNRMNFLDEQRAREQIVTPSEGNQVANSAEFYNLRREIQSNHIHKKSEMALKVEQSDIESQKLDKSKPLDLDSLPYEEPATETKDKQINLMRVSGQKKLLCGVAAALESQDGGHMSDLWLRDAERRQIAEGVAAHLQTADFKRNEADSSCEEEVFRTQKMGGLDQLSQNRIRGDESDFEKDCQKPTLQINIDCSDDDGVNLKQSQYEIQSDEMLANEESVRSSTDCKNFLKKFEKNASLKRRSGALMGLAEYGQDNKIEDQDSALDAILDSANFCNDFNSEIGVKMQNSEQKSPKIKAEQNPGQDIEADSEIKVDLSQPKAQYHNRIQSIGTSLGADQDFAPSKALLDMKLAPSLGAEEDRSQLMKDDQISIEGLQLESLANSAELNEENAEKVKSGENIEENKVDKEEENLQKVLENLINQEVEESILMMVEFGHPNLIVEEDKLNE